MSNYKKIGVLTFNDETLSDLQVDHFQSFIKMLMVPENFHIQIDFNLYVTVAPTLFFISPNQHLNVLKATDEEAFMVYYNRDFYCIQIHDAEVACDGLLFNNIFENPKVELSQEDSEIISLLFLDIQLEMIVQDTSAEEMIRSYIKLIIIRATREWKKQNLHNKRVNVPNMEQEFIRNFSRLLEIHYREKHSVADYAEILNMAPKTLSAKFNKFKLESPNDMIKNRIVLEAKRLLHYTDLTVKEISYALGYDDPAYFNRLFTQKTGSSPAAFKKSKDIAIVIN